jgi:hypothetical protein
MPCFFRGIGKEFRKIKLAFTLVNMVLKPKSNRLNIGIPWIHRVVGMAIIAGFFKNT